MKSLRLVIILLPIFNYILGYTFGYMAGRAAKIAQTTITSTKP